MAECAAVSHIKLHLPGDYAKGRRFIPQKSYIQIKRKCSFESYKFGHFSSWNFREFRGPIAAYWKVNSCLKDSSIRSRCLGSLMNSSGATTSDWIPIVDQVLLMASIFLTYVAGVVPAKSPLLNSGKGLTNNQVVSKSPTFYGSATENDEDFEVKFAWDTVEAKLMDSLNAVEHEVDLKKGAISFDPKNAKQPLHLYALTGNSRLRLLWISLQLLKKEVDSIPESFGSVCRDEWLSVCCEIARKSCKPVCIGWLEKEFLLKNSKKDKAFLSSVVEKLEGDDTIVQSIRKSGKEGLYSELMRFLRFGCLRVGCHYDTSLFSLHGVSILEDLVITLADGVASRYLELISVDGNMSNELNSVGLMLCNLSTRALQRLRNEVALNQWLHQNMEAVASMYEDRFDLCTLQNQLIDESKNSQSKFSWWEKLTLSKSPAMASPLRYVVISYISVPVKRTEELRALTGWRYYFSLFLEMTDITMPLIRTIISKIGDAISFFLVCLIGRSLGLIYSGIRQSLRWK